MQFSVVIPVYNAAPYLEQCLDSLLAQTFADWEAICVDDGSPDGCGAILDRYAAQDARFVVIHQANGGEGAARNAGLSVARGRWICFLDADDVLRPQALESFAAGSEAVPTADICAVRRMLFEHGEDVRWPVADACGWRSVDLRTRIPEEAFMLSVWRCAYRSARFGDMRFCGLGIGADRVYLIEALERAGTLATGDVVGYGYRQHDGSTVRAALTARKFLHELRHQLMIVGIVRRSSKAYDACILRTIGLMFVKWYAESYVKLSREDRRQVKDEWLAAIRTVLDCPWVCGTVRLRAALAVRIRSGVFLLFLGRLSMAWGRFKKRFYPVKRWICVNLLGGTH